MANKVARKILTLGKLKNKYDADYASAIVIPKEESLYIPSRMLAFTNLIGGGFPYGKIIEFYGEENSGKTLMAFDAAYCTQKLGGMVLWGDVEHSYTEHWSKLNGIDNDKVILYQETAIEKVSDWSADWAYYLRSTLTNNEPILLVIDSVASLTTLANKDSDATDAKAEMGNRAKAIDKFLRERNELFHDLGVTVICINQLRSKIGASKYEDPDVTPGGKAMKFYASIRIGFYGSSFIKGKIDGEEEEIGRMVSIRVKKNKVAPKKKTLLKVPMYFHTDCGFPIGFDKYYDLPHILERKKVVFRNKNTSIIRDKNDNMIARGAASFTQLLLDDITMRRKYIRKSGIVTISKCIKQLASKESNLFPVKQSKSTSDEEES